MQVVGKGRWWGWRRDRAGIVKGGDGWDTRTLFEHSTSWLWTSPLASGGACHAFPFGHDPGSTTPTGRYDKTGNPLKCINGSTFSLVLEHIYELHRTIVLIVKNIMLSMAGAVAKRFKGKAGGAAILNQCKQRTHVLVAHSASPVQGSQQSQISRLFPSQNP